MFPIILAHGIARFDILRELLAAEIGLPPNPLDDQFQYFRNIRTYLNGHGFNEVFNTNVDFAGSLALRSEQLKLRVDDVLDRTGAEKVHIIAHSMGGLDARRMIVDLEMAGRVASLTTIGTPHLGTVLADQVIANGGTMLIEALEKAVNIDLDGFRDLTTGACDEFNRRAEDAEAENAVFYQTFASSQKSRNVFLPLLPSWFAIRALDGANDGLVSARSQRWKSELAGSGGQRKPIRRNEFPIPADHLNQVGWWDWQEAVSPLLGAGYANQRASYEKRVKDVYLAIARGLAELP